MKKTGQPSKLEVVCYPRDTSSSSNQSDQYTPAIVPTDLIHVRVGVSPPPGIIVTIHAVPPQFPLAATYIDTLLSLPKYDRADFDVNKAVQVDAYGAAPKETEVSSPWRAYENVVVPPLVLGHVKELIGGYLWRTDIPAIVKESMFHMLSQCLRMLHHSESGSLSGMFPSFSPSPISSSLPLLMQLQSELRRLYEEEIKTWATVTTVSGTGMGLGVGDSGRFSTYFHSLMEICLAVGEMAAPFSPAGISVTSGMDGGLTPSSSGSSLPPTPTSPMATGKRKKLKAKRERDRGSTTPMRSGSPLRPVDGDSMSPLSTSPSGPNLLPPPSGSSSGSSVSSSGSNVSLSGSKPEDMLWFHRALTMSQILRFMTYGDVQGEGVTNDAIADACQVLMTPTAHTRLLVISGIPTTLDEQMVKNAIRKACNSNGGLFKGELFLPIQEIEIRPEKSSTPKKLSASEQKGKPVVKPKSGQEAKSDSKSSKDEANQAEVIKTKCIKGYAVIELRSKTKVEGVRKSLFKSKMLLEGLNIDPDEIVDMPEDMSILVVNQSLFTDPSGNNALESYLLDKLVTNKQTSELSDNAMIALTEIFHSCFICEQRISLVERQDSGYICLGRDQIIMQAPGNLLYTFFNNVRAVKKTFTEQISHVLKRYGIPKSTDKEE